MIVIPEVPHVDLCPLLGSCFAGPERYGPCGFLEHAAEAASSASTQTGCRRLALLGKIWSNGICLKQNV